MRKRMFIPTLAAALSVLIGACEDVNDVTDVAEDVAIGPDDPATDFDPPSRAEVVLNAKEALSMEAQVKEAIPLANALELRLRTILSDKDGRSLPLGIGIGPRQPEDDDQVAAVFICPWGSACEPFFEACASLQLNCSDGSWP